ncbi:MAG: UbiA family prenyltransferase [Methylacidiphilales bacterium]|nr:UbiA family prenyltransferase [Candidatus Methylacidiphilales bacterium]
MNEIPLCVDLDGTLILTDTTVESLLLAMTDERGLIFRIPLWFLRGRAQLKQMLSKHVMLNVSLLPLNQPLVDYLKEQHGAGRTLILVTAADIHIAREMAARIGLFDEVIASDGVTNLAGRHKAEALQKRFGKGGFDYAGNEHRDLAVWEICRNAIVVSGSPALARKAEKVCKVEKSFIVPPPTPREWIKALRVHQWTKNLLLFIPILGAHAWSDFTKVSSVVIAFLVFCIGASSVYILNDLLDLELDREHVSKHRRPFASGQISLPMGIAAMVLLFVFASGLMVLALPWRFCLVFAGYYLLTLLYSHRLKRIVLVDVFILASLYCIRIFAGGEAAQVSVSRWLLAFSLFLFLSLALAKRFTEMRSMLSANAPKIKGRGYQVADLEPVSSMGIVSGYIAVLVLAFYINNPNVTMLYRHPGALWAACIVILYWISRIWLLAHRGVLHDDPVVFTIKDRQSWLAGLVLVLIAMAAMPK